MTEAAQKKTPLYDDHVKRGAKMVSFAGWLMPVQYTSIVEEHHAVRNNVGMFDISHMGQLIVAATPSSQKSGGEGAAATWLNTMLTNNLEKLGVGMGQYTFLLNNRGGVIDDLIAYRVGDEKFLLVVNAARADEDFAWLNKYQTAPSPQSSQRSTRSRSRGGREAPGEGQSTRTRDILLYNRSADFGGVAIQGPRVVELFRALDVDLPPRNHIVDLAIAGMPVSIARTGYTGEDGLEAFFRASDAMSFWNLILEKGENFGAKPCGLGARDTLRLEMCYPLNGSDLSPERNPIEAGLGFFVDLAKPNFIGRDVLLKVKENGPREKLVPFRMNEKGPPPRPHYAVFAGAERIGEVTSGTLSPSLNWGIGMAYIDSARAKIGATIEIEIRGQKFPATIEKKPLYKKEKPLPPETPPVRLGPAATTSSS